MLKKALLSSYLTQAYVSLIGLILMPFYLRHMGVEAFGLIGVFWMLQTWVQLLDLGLTPTFSREISRYRAGAIQVADAWRLVRGMEGILGVLAIFIILCFIFAKHWLAQHWLSQTSFTADEVAWSIVAMVVAASLRWLTGLYRAGMVGLERQIWVNGAASVFATLRFVGVAPIILFVSYRPLVFFGYQALIGLLEIIVYRLVFYAALPRIDLIPRPKLESLRTLIPMASAMAFMSGIWIFQTQVDKIILSKLLTLSAYGHFTLAVMVSGGVLMLIPPLNQVLQPRLTILATQGNVGDIQVLYSNATQFVTALFGALGITIAIFAQPLLHTWTANSEAAVAAGPILFWYGLANALLGLLVLPFTLQFAYGYLKLQIIGSIVSSLLMFPAILYMSYKYGAVGAGKTFFFTNLLYLMLWVPLAHRRLLQSRQWHWLVHDIAPIALVVSVSIFAASRVMPNIENRWIAGVAIFMVFSMSAFLGLMVGSRSRHTLLAILRKTR